MRRSATLTPSVPIYLQDCSWRQVDTSLSPSGRGLFRQDAPRTEITSSRLETPAAIGWKTERDGAKSTRYWTRATHGALKQRPRATSPVIQDKTLSSSLPSSVTLSKTLSLTPDDHAETVVAVSLFEVFEFGIIGHDYRTSR